MDESRLRLRYMRENPAVALTVLGEDSWYAQVTLLGRVVSIEDDPDLAGIDRLSIRYLGKPYQSRDARRVTAWMEPHRWTAWPLPPLAGAASRPRSRAPPAPDPARGRMPRSCRSVVLHVLPLASLACLLCERCPRDGRLPRSAPRSR